MNNSAGGQRHDPCGVSGGQVVEQDIAGMAAQAIASLVAEPSEQACDLFMMQASSAAGSRPCGHQQAPRQP